MPAFLKQLWKRKVIQFGAYYLAAAWLLFQVAIAVESTLDLPDWLDQAALVLLLIGFPLVLILAWAQESSSKTEKEPASGDSKPSASMAQNTPKEKLSIAVLPFVNMSEERDHEFFADGMTEDLLTALSVNQHMSVAARTSSFQYKGKSDDIRAIGQELGVDYVVEGSVRPMGDRIRITCQLIQAETGAHIWAEKYDRALDSLFEIQDEVLGSIAQALNVNLALGEGARLTAAKPQSLTNWQKVQQLAARIYTGAIKEHREAVPLLETIVEEEPDYAYATSMLAFAYLLRTVNGTSRDPRADFKRALPLIEKGLALAPGDPQNLYFCACAAGYSGQYQRAIDLAETGLSINPNLIELYAPIAQASTNLGDYAKADAALDKGDSISLDLWKKGSMWYRAILRSVELRYEEALPLLKKTIDSFPEYMLPRLYLAIALDALGDDNGAKEAIHAAHGITPSLDFRSLKATFRAYTYPEDGEAERRIALLEQLWPSGQAT